MDGPEPLSSSLEDYLEVIFHLTSESTSARAKDIAARLGVRSPSVTGALRVLAARELVNYTPYGAITLTAKGDLAAREVVRRHEALKDFLEQVLGIAPAEADDAACKMEHAVSRNILERFIEFADFVGAHPRIRRTWQDRLGP
ncbi:MAG TPA: metal-dependent transcriptional regulator [Candidatus Hydrogenedentes bacterium]|nr:metal-dependent transcriptional regulator [Candidatus Hydrogenedentota bacterium]HPG65776.1 metal-dependent transcriptional regulator [Candidatus Hydrogenedentota bacterium]